MNVLDQDIMKVSGNIRLNKMVDSINLFNNSDKETKQKLLDSVKCRSGKITPTRRLVFKNREEQVKYYEYLSEDN